MKGGGGVISLHESPWGIRKPVTSQNFEMWIEK